MKTLKPITILASSFLVTLTVFSQTNAALNYLPGNAKMIIKINPASLGQKMKWEELVKYKMFEDLMKEAPEGKDFFTDPALTGIDLAQGLFLIVPANSNNKKPAPILCGILKDTTRFAAMIKKTSPKKQPVKIGSGKLIIDGNTALAWNKEVFIFTGTTNKQKLSNQNVKTKTPAELTQTKQLTQTCKTILNKKNPSLTNENFTSLLREQGDLYLWMNNSIQSEPQKKGKAQEVVGMLNKNFMKRGNFSSAVVNFENGKVVAQMKRYVSGSLDSIYKKYPSKNINTKLLRKLPSGHAIFLGSFNFSTEMLNEILAKAGADKYIDSASKQKIKIEDVLSAIRGDITLAGLKVYEFTEEDSVTQALNGMQVFLTGHINDKEKFKRLITLLEKKEQDTTTTKPTKMKPLVFSNDSVFVVSISQIAAQKFLDAPGGNEEIEKMVSPYKDHPSAFFLDLKTIFGFAMQKIAGGKSDEEAKQTSEALGMFDKVISYGGEYNNSSTSSTIELTLTNKDENSFRQFMNLFNQFYSMRPKPSSAYNR
jgi:hypothetical protein